MRWLRCFLFVVMESCMGCASFLIASGNENEGSGFLSKISIPDFKSYYPNALATINSGVSCPGRTQMEFIFLANGDCALMNLGECLETKEIGRQQGAFKRDIKPERVVLPSKLAMRLVDILRREVDAAGTLPLAHGPDAFYHTFVVRESGGTFKMAALSASDSHHSGRLSQVLLLIFRPPGLGDAEVAGIRLPQIERLLQELEENRNEAVLPPVRFSP